MSTLTTARPVEHERQLNSDQHEPLLPVRRVKFLDRLALHLGLALIKWGRRSQDLPSRERIANRVEQALARESRIQVDERTARLLLPVR
jgi:hypothetical protein